MSTTEPLTISEAADSLGVPKQTLRHLLQRPDRRARLLHAYRNTKKGLKTVELIPLDLLDELSVAFPAAPSATAISLGEDDAPLSADHQDDVTLSADASQVADPDSAGPVAANESSQAADATLSASSTARKSRSSARAAKPPADEVDSTLPAVEAALETDSAEVQTSLVEPIPPLDIKLGSVGREAGDSMMIVATYERLLAEREARLLEMHGALESERANTRRLADSLSSAQTALAIAQETLATALQMRELALAQAAESAAAPAAAPAPSAPTPRRGFWARVFSR